MNMLFCEILGEIYVMASPYHVMACACHEKNASHTYHTATIQLLMEQDTYIALQPILPQSSYSKMGERMVWQGPWAFK